LASFAALRVVTQALAQGLPVNPVLEPDLAGRRKETRIVKGHGRDVERSTTLFILVCERGAAIAAKGAQDLWGRTVCARRAIQNLELLTLKGQPSDGGRGGGPATRLAMTND
jgi:hypothetical protein